MNWLFFAILSPLVYTINNFVDKYILSSQLKDYRGVLIYSSVMATIFGTFFWFIFGMPILSLHDALLIILSGMFTFYAMVMYFKAQSLEETSKIIILFQMGPIIVLILSMIFLKEVINMNQLIGFILIMASSVGVSLQTTKSELKISKPFFLILLNQIMWSVGAILFKFVVDQNSFVKVVSYESWGIALGGFTLFICSKNIRESFLDTFKTVKRKVIFFVFVNEGIFIIARLLTFLAFSMGSVSLVTVIGSTSVFFGLIIGTFLTVLLPSIFKEDISKRNLIKKAGFAILAFIGIYLIY